MSEILVTGATGFLGTRLVQKLLESGFTPGSIRVLARPVSVRNGARDISPWKGQPSVEVFQGDIRDPRAVVEAMKGISRVFHLAGLVSREREDGPALYRIHVDGTRYVCEAAARQGVQKIVVVSSSGTVAVSRGPTVHGETGDFAYKVVGRWPYYLSKIFQEKLALSYYRDRDLPVVIVNPSLLLGPGDVHLRSCQDVALFLRRKIFGIPNGGLNFVDVRDAASALLSAMEKGRAGQRYLIGGPNQSFAEFFRRLEVLSNVRAPRVRFSASAAMAAAKFQQVLERVTGRRFPVRPVSVEMSTCFWYLDATKARSELGFSPRDPEETLRDTVEDVRCVLAARARGLS
ncbi:MAG: NAD-dependent epimerase/dehydratase family protein [Acidobacteria bacterium]|nr:NAD-dependent epimerase/dehydratase family protein [Acidobacteriota bacterium]